MALQSRFTTAPDNLRPPKSLSRIVLVPAKQHAPFVSKEIFPKMTKGPLIGAVPWKKDYEELLHVLGNKSVISAIQRSN